LKKKSKNKFASFITNALILIGVLIIVSNIYLLVKAKNSDKLPSLFGYKLLIELSDSMNDTIKTGDLLIIKDVKSSDILVGDILSYRGEKNKIITHRVTGLIIRDEKYYFETKGDNNDSKDLDLVPGKSIEGVMVHRIKSLGFIFSFLNTMTGKVVIVLVTLIIFLSTLFIAELKKEKNKEEELEII